MKVVFISVWRNFADLVRQVRFAIDDSALVVVKNLIMDEAQYVAFLFEFGQPDRQMKNNPKHFLAMGAAPFEETGSWYDKRTELTTHVDGIMNVTGEHKFLPTTFLYGVDIVDPRGGLTYFQDNHDLFDRAKIDPVLSNESFEYITADYWNETLGPSAPRVEQPILRYSPWTGKPYLLIDKWFTKRLKIPATMRTWSEDIILRQYNRVCLDSVYKYHHQWENRDLLVWSNESFVHGRSVIEGGSRVMWRGIVWDTHLHPPKPPER